MNPHLVRDLVGRGLWTDATRQALIRNGGSVQEMPGLDPDLKELYRTVWEIKQRALIDMAADR